MSTMNHGSCRRYWRPVVAAVAMLGLTASVHAQSYATPKVFDPAPPTTWAPTGCRAVPYDDAILASRSAWRNLHADATGSDELSIALAPDFVADWIAEPDTFNVTGPVFDDQGNLYFSPLYPHENVVLISTDPADGSRRWAIPGTGATAGTGTPLVLDDPLAPGEQLIYLGLYDRALAVRTDGTIVWDVSTGLTLPTSGPLAAVFGVNYVPAFDAIAGLTRDGHVYLLDRATGASLLATPHQLPGEPSPPSETTYPPQYADQVVAELSPLLNFPEELDTQGALGVLLGNGSEVANFFSIDPRSGRLWVAATAPDGEDGTVDGVSEFGALYGLDIVPSGTDLAIVEGCHRYFNGGSASTPALRADGTRVYVGDNDGDLIAVDADCNELWTVSIGAQLIGSVAVASDNGELYVATLDNIIQVIDRGAFGEISWTAALDVYDIPTWAAQFNLNLVSIGANGVSFQAGAGFPTANAGLPVATGVGVLDRATGAVRQFADGLDETVAVMSTGPDGALYIGNSPVRHAIYRVIAPGVPAIIGGIRKFAPKRHDLLLRDALLAAADRAANANAVGVGCPDSALADVAQIEDLMAQVRRTIPLAATATDIMQSQADAIDTGLLGVEAALSASDLAMASSALSKLACVVDPSPAVEDTDGDGIPDACDPTPTGQCPATPQGGCLGTAKYSFQVKQGSTPEKHRLKWKLTKGEAFGSHLLGTPLTTSAYRLCVYDEVDGHPTLAGTLTAGPGAGWEDRGPKGYRYRDKLGLADGISKLELRVGLDGKTKVQLQARKSHLPLPGPTALETFYQQDPQVTVQLTIADAPTCWTTSFATASRNTPEQFEAKKP